jgi:hypothetical protein
MKLKQIGSNQTELLINGTVVFFSYETPVAARLACGALIRTETKYSVTTSKHINKWVDGWPVVLVKQNVIDNLTNEVTA